MRNRKRPTARKAQAGVNSRGTPRRWGAADGQLQEVFAVSCWYLPLSEPPASQLSLDSHHVWLSASLFNQSFERCLIIVVIGRGTVELRL